MHQTLIDRNLRSNLARSWWYLKPMKNADKTKQVEKNFKTRNSHDLFSKHITVSILNFEVISSLLRRLLSASWTFRRIAYHI